MAFELSVQYGTKDSSLPARAQVRRWVRRAYELACEASEPVDLRLTIRYVGNAEGRGLNREFRQKDYATNVLTFPYDADAVSSAASPPKRTKKQAIRCADVAICAPVVVTEAKEQRKTIHAHHAHMVVHATLHALGFDHENEIDAQHMETLETRVLHRFRIKNPYA